MFRALQINVVPLPWEGNVDGKQEGIILKPHKENYFGPFFTKMLIYPTQRNSRDLNHCFNFNANNISKQKQNKTKQHKI